MLLLALLLALASATAQSTSYPSVKTENGDLKLLVNAGQDILFQQGSTSTSVSSLRSTLASLQSNKADVTAVQSQIQSSATELSGQVSAVQAALQAGLASRATVATTDALSSAVTSVSGAVSALAATVGLKANASSVSTALSSVLLSASSMSDAAESRVRRDVSSDLSTLLADVTTVGSTVNSVNSGVSTVSSALAQVGSSVAGLGSTLGGVGGDVSTLRSTVAAVRSDLSQLRADLQAGFAGLNATLQQSATMGGGACTAELNTLAQLVNQTLQLSKDIDCRSHIKWVSFNGNQQGLIYGSSGVSTVTRASAGIYTVQWTQPFPDNHYAVMGSTNFLGTGGAAFGLENLPGLSGGNLNTFQSPTAVSVGARTTSSSSNSNTDVDLIMVVAIGKAPAECNLAMEERFVVFDGTSNDNRIWAQQGVSSVTKVGTGHYDITWAAPRANISSFAVAGATNFYNSGGAHFGLEGNLIPGSSTFAFSAAGLSVGARNGANSNVNAAYVAVVSIGLRAVPRPSEKWVSFNGQSLEVYGRQGVQSVARVSAGNYRITWSIPYETDGYAVVGCSNMLGPGGTIFGLESNIDGSGNNVNDMLPGSVMVGTRQDESNVSFDSDLIFVIAFGPE
eukprot:m.35690 g.35690  ORF g.35690 m.35690 type:complete len:623 (+) comp13287_c0_seq1:50-1918(+)